MFILLSVYSRIIYYYKNIVLLFKFEAAERRKKQMEKYGFDTLSLHAGFDYDKVTGSTAVPLYQTNAYQFDSAEHATALFELKESGNIYTRLNNPTNEILEKRLTALEDGVGSLVTSSGHAAMFLTFSCLCSAGDEIVSSSAIYGGAINLLGVSLKNFGITTKFVNPDKAENFEAAITDKTKCIFVEVLGNPNSNLCDIEEVGKIAKKYKIPFIVDSTLTTPYLINPKKWGADIVIHSTTKFIGGHGTSMGGAAVDLGTFDFMGNDRFPQFNNPDSSYHGVVFGKDFGNAGFVYRLRTLSLRDFGPCASPFNSMMILQGIETLSLRMERHCSNALAVAELLEKDSRVKAVNYPGLKSSPYYEKAQKLLPKGAGAVFTFELDGDRKMGAKFIDSVKLFKNVANLGDTKSLVIHPASTTHSQLSKEQLKAAGVGEGTIRLSVGLEDVNDLLTDIKSAIDAAIE